MDYQPADERLLPPAASPPATTPESRLDEPAGVLRVYDAADASPEQRVERALAEADAFDRYKRELLDSRHFDYVGGKPRINSAGWDHLAAQLRVSVVLLSRHSDGTPGARREVLESLEGKRFLAYSASVRASRAQGSSLQAAGREAWQEVAVERTGRTESTEKSMLKKASKGVLTEDFLEIMAVNRAKNRAICALLGGSPGEIADDAEDILESNAAAREEAPQPLGWNALVQLALDKNVITEPADMLGWLHRNLPSTENVGPGQRTRLTVGESLQAQRLLSGL